MPLFEQLCWSGVTLPGTLERIRPCQLEMKRAQMMTGCKSTLSRKARAKANTTSQKRKSHDQHDQHELYRHQHVQELWQNLDTGRRTAGDQEEERATIPQVTTATRREQGSQERQRKSKHVDVVETNQPPETASAVAYASQTPSTVGDLSCISYVEPWIMGVTIDSVSTRRQAGAEYLLLDSGAQLHASRTKGTVS